MARLFGGLSRDTEIKGVVLRVGDELAPEYDVQQRELDEEKKYVQRRDEQPDAILGEWERTVDDLEHDALSTSDRLELSAKYVLYRQYMGENGLNWKDDVMQSLDLEYHNVSPRDGLFYGLEAAGAMPRLTTDAEVNDAITTPPQNTRALGRGKMVSTTLKKTGTR